MNTLPEAAAFSVSIIVPTYNRAHYLGECLDSLLQQTLPALEIIVVDDGSEDDTATVVAAYGARVRYIRKENGGKPRAVNLGISLAQGALIWIFDDDDVALPTAIESRLATLRANPQAGFVYSPHYYGTDGSDGRIVRGRLHSLPAHNPAGFFLALMLGCFFHLATALVRIEVYRDVGDFDEELLSSEDYDMQLRLARKHGAVLSPEPVFIFRQHAGVRGARAIRYAGALRGEVFRRYDQRVGSKLRNSLSLGEYLCPSQLLPLDAQQTRQALLNRMQVMASKGCIDEFFSDLLALTVDTEADFIHPGQSLPRDVRQAIRQSVCTGYAEAALLVDEPAVRRQLGRLQAHAQAGTAIRMLAAGFFALAKGYPGSAPVRARRLLAAFRFWLYSLPGR